MSLYLGLFINLKSKMKKYSPRSHEDQEGTLSLHEGTEIFVFTLLIN